MIEEKQIQEIIDKTDMVGLVSEYVTLTKRGKNYFGLCPFHDDQTPSFSVSPEKKIAKCMSCGEGGNPINFLRKIKNISFEEACVELADKVGVKLNNVKSPKKVDKNARLYEINEMAMKFYEQYLFNTKSGKVALDYLTNRGLSIETIKAFHIGLAPKEHETLTHVLKDKGYSLVDATDLALVKQNKMGYYDNFTNRIMFPIIDDFGRTVGFSGRIFYESSTEPKYVNSEETPIFIKGEMLYNLNNAIKHIRKKGRVILCEGQMDVIACTNAGVGEAICSLGTALTEGQVSLLKKYASNVLIMYDGDSAGIKATRKAFNLLKGFKTSAVVLPDKQDPDEFIKKYGKEKFINYLDNNQKDILEFLYFHAFYNKNLDLSFDYEAVKKEVFDFLKPLESTTLVERYLRFLARDLKVSFEAIFNDFKLTKNSLSRKEEILVKEPTQVIKAHELDFLAFVASKKAYYDYFKRALKEVENYLENESALNMYLTINYCYQEGITEGTNLMRYVTSNCKPEDSELLNKLFDAMTRIENYDEDKIEKVLEDIVKKFEQEAIEKESKELSVTTNDVTDEVLELLNKKLNLLRSSKKER